MVVEDGCQVARGDPRAAAQRDGALDGRLQLADVARPVVPLEGVERIAVKPVTFLRNSCA